MPSYAPEAPSTAVSDPQPLRRSATRGDRSRPGRLGSNELIRKRSLVQVQVGERPGVARNHGSRDRSGSLSAVCDARAGYGGDMYRSLSMYPTSADPARVAEIVDRTAAAFKQSPGFRSFTTSVDALMGRGREIATWLVLWSSTSTHSTTP